MNEAMILPSDPISQANEPHPALSSDLHLNSPDSRFKTVYEAVTVVDDAKTFVTSHRLSDDDSFDDDVSPRDELNDDAIGGHVPSEVNVSYDCNEDSSEYADDDDASSGSSDVSEEDDDEEFDESDYESEGIEEKDGNPTEGEDDSCYSSRTDTERRHELFLPRDTSPTYEELKYDTEDEDSAEEEEMPSVTSRRNFPTTNDSCRPRRMMMLTPPKRLYERHVSPSSISISSSSSEDSTSIRSHVIKQSNAASRRPCVSFDNTVAVYPVFETDAYSPSMIQNMYTNREELRVNKLRNKREFAYDDNDWRNATEECDMQSDEDGELVHPVHTAKRTLTRGPFLSNTSSSIWQVSGAGVVHRAKRMRMYYP